MKKLKEIDKSTSTVGDFNTSLLVINGTSKKKNQQECRTKQHYSQLKLTDINRIFHLTTVEYTLVSRAQGTFAKMDHIMNHKTNLNNIK